MFSSTAGAAEYRGDSLGEFVRMGDYYNNRPYYKQEDTEGRSVTFNVPNSSSSLQKNHPKMFAHSSRAVQILHRERLEHGVQRTVTFNLPGHLGHSWKIGPNL